MFCDHACTVQTALLTASQNMKLYMVSLSNFEVSTERADTNSVRKHNQQKVEHRELYGWGIDLFCKARCISQTASQQKIEEVPFWRGVRISPVPACVTRVCVSTCAALPSPRSLRTAPRSSPDSRTAAPIKSHAPVRRLSSELPGSRGAPPTPSPHCSLSVLGNWHSALWPPWFSKGLICSL